MRAQASSRIRSRRSIKASHANPIAGTTCPPSRYRPIAARIAVRPGRSRACGPLRATSRAAARSRLPGRALHGLRAGAGDRGDGRGDRVPARQHPLPEGGHRPSRGIGDRIESHPLGRAAGRVGAQVGPVAAVLDSQHVLQPDPGPWCRCAAGIGQRGDQPARAVSGHNGDAELMAG